MSKAQKMIQNLDQLQITLNPYEAHYLQELDQPTRALYLQMLYSVVSLSNLNNAQNRVWELLSQSIEADDVSTDEMGIELIKKFAEDAIADGLEYCFILDLLVLLRLNSVSKDQAKVVAELMSILKLNDEDLATLMHLSNLILKIEDKVQNLVDFDYQTVRHWHEFSYQVLTENILTENFIAGNWLLTQDFTDINKTIEIQDSTFACLGVTFTIEVENSRVRSARCAFKNNFNLKGCDAVFEACQFYNISMRASEDSNNLVFTKSVFENEFIASDILQSYFIMEEGQYEFTDNEFKLINISGIESKENVEKLVLENCSFNDTGNPLGYGAVKFFNCSTTIKNSNFNNCVSNIHGSAIHFIAATSSKNSNIDVLIENSSFSNCTSKDYWKEVEHGFAVYMNYHTSTECPSLETIIEQCNFVASNIALRLEFWNDWGIVNTINKSNFESSQVYHVRSTERSTRKGAIRFADCTFNNKKLENLVEVASD